MLSSFWQTIFIKPLTNLLILITFVLPGHDLGLAIIVITIIVRIILYPSSKKAIINQRALQAYQPELDKIKQKYKGDKEKQNKATLEFYQKHKINPLSSCLPLLIQLPILIALYWVFRNVTSANFSSFLYSFTPHITDLNIKFLGLVDLSKPEVYVLPVLAGASQFYQSWMIMRSVRKEAKENVKKEEMTTVISKQMNYIFPIVTIVFAASLPAAIALYWVVTNLFSIGQQYIIMKNDRQKPKIIVKKK